MSKWQIRLEDGTILKTLNTHFNALKEIEEFLQLLPGARKFLLVEINTSVKAGDKVRIISMKGEAAYSGKTGTVTHIDDAGQIHGTWGGCAIIPETDYYEVLEEDENE